MCSLAAELIVKAGALGIGAQGGGKTTTAAAGTTRCTQYVFAWRHEVRVCVRGGCEINCKTHDAGALIYVTFCKVPVHTYGETVYIYIYNTIAAVNISVNSER